MWHFILPFYLSCQPLLNRSPSYAVASRAQAPQRDKPAARLPLAFRQKGELLGDKMNF